MNPAGLKTPPQTPIAKAKAAIPRLPLSYAESASRIAQLRRRLEDELAVLRALGVDDGYNHVSAAILELENATKTLLAVP